MANAEIDALMDELEALSASPGRRVDELDELQEVLEQGTEASELNPEDCLSPAVCPLQKRALRKASDSSPTNGGSVSSPASLGSEGNRSIESGDFIQPRPPLVPKRSADRSGSAGSMQSGQSTSRSSATGSKGDLFSSEVVETENVIADMELELENLLNGGNNSSPSKGSKGVKNMNASSSGMAMAEVLNVDDFDDTPRSVDVDEIVHEVTSISNEMPAIEQDPDGDRLSREVKSALESPARFNQDEQQHPPAPREERGASMDAVDAGSTIFTPLPVVGVITDPKKKKCIKVTLHGGPQAVRGIKESSFARNVCCNNLLCVKCNFSVLTFRGAAWDSSVDYMFFRNSSCKADKLSSKLMTSENCAAYACQCSWVTCDDGEMEPSGLGLNWCCAGHLLDVATE